MLFLVNPGNRKDRKVRRVKTGKVARRVARRRKRPAKIGAHSEGTMARRRRRSRVKARANAPRRRSVRRRRRSVVRVMHANPPVRHRRRRRPILANSHRRRRFRRNPGFVGGGGIVTTLKNGVMDGVTVLAGEIIQNKAVGLVDHFVPTMTGVAGMARTAGLNLAIATAGTMVARKVAPNRSRMLAAGLFARAIANTLATTPIAPLLGDGAVYDALPPGYGAYPQGFSAYPAAATADVPHAEH